MNRWAGTGIVVNEKELWEDPESARVHMQMKMHKGKDFITARIYGDQNNSDQVWSFFT